MRCPPRVALCLVALALALPAGASASPLDDALARIEAARAGVRALRADFVQEKVVSLFAETVRSTGKLVVRRPDRLRWQVLAPDESLFVIAGPSVRYRLPGARGNVDVRTAGALGAVLRDLVAFLAGPLGEVRGRYRLALAEGNPVVLVATPTSRDVARSVRTMRLRFSRDLRVLDGVVLEEPGGDRADIRFTNVRINPQVPDSAFTLRE